MFVSDIDSSVSHPHLLLTLKEEGNVLFKQQEFEKALLSYTKALRIDSNENDKAILYKNRAACYLKINQYDKAVKDCTNGKFITTLEIFS